MVWLILAEKETRVLRFVRSISLMQTQQDCRAGPPVISLGLLSASQHIYTTSAPPPTFKEQKKLTYQLLEGCENVVWSVIWKIALLSSRVCYKADSSECIWAVSLQAWTPGSELIFSACSFRVCWGMSHLCSLVRVIGRLMFLLLRIQINKYLDYNCLSS